ncbi:Flp pilus assembly complex ATPase component TadA [Candidatus Microgenomates bacterium]|nr:Flp pilus assembly complex ATPase component TadA [Candidatus Microgenomates bacterium]
MPDTALRTLESVLFENGSITQEQLDLVKQESINTGKSIEQVLLDRGFVDSEGIIKARSSLLGIESVDLQLKAIPPQAVNLVPEQVARLYNILPFDIDEQNRVLSVAMANPLDINGISFLEKKTAFKIRPYFSKKDDIKVVSDTIYNQGLATQVTAALNETQNEVLKTADIKEVESVIRDAPVAKILSSLLEFAIKARASDIHIEPLGDHTRVRFRIDGILYEKLILPSKIHDSLVSRVKILSEMKIDEKRVPQDGRFNYKIESSEVDVRVSTLPTSLGEKVVMRLLRKSGGVPTLTDLGLRGTALRNLETSILRPHGIIVVCGPTGSGKTTTLYAVLSKINSSKVNIVTLEDPVEYQIGGVNQVQVNAAAGLTFAAGLRSFLRQDPNIILVGEIRDGETTDLAIQAALTGHLVFSTLHTSTAAGTIPRLLDLGGEPFLLASSLNAVVGQRILRKICPSCKESYIPPEIMQNDIKTVLGPLLTPDKLQNGQVCLYKGKGCKECGDSGFLGRVGIFEVLAISDKISKLILSRCDAGQIENLAIEEGMIPMKQDG